MSKVQLQVAKAFEAFKKGVDKRNARNTEKEISSFIEEQIELKTREVKDIEASLEKHIEQNERDFIETLALLDEDSIRSVSDREHYAESYVTQGIAMMMQQEDYKEDQKDTIDDLNEEIKYLKDFRAILSTLAEKIEVEE